MIKRDKGSVSETLRSGRGFSCHYSDERQLLLVSVVDDSNHGVSAIYTKVGLPRS